MLIGLLMHVRERVQDFITRWDAAWRLSSFDDHLLKDIGVERREIYRRVMQKPPEAGKMTDNSCDKRAAATARAACRSVSDPSTVFNSAGPC